MAIEPMAIEPMAQIRPRPRRLMVALAGWVATLRRATMALRASNNATPVQTNVVVMSSLPRKFERILCRDLRESGKTGFLRYSARSLSNMMAQHEWSLRLAHSFESLHRRCCVGGRHRRFCTWRGAAAWFVSRSCHPRILRRPTLDGFRPRAAHAFFGGLPALPR